MSGALPLTTSSEPSALADLLARVEAATGADRELDADLWWVLDHRSAESCFNTGALGLPKERPATLPIPDGLGRAGVRAMAPKFTGSVDAALVLLERVCADPARWSWVIAKPGRDDGVLKAEYGAVLYHPLSSGGGPKWEGYAKTPALALLASMLRALAGQQP